MSRRISRVSRRKFVGGMLAFAAPAGAQQTGGIAGFDHVALPMQNTESMLAFYRALGLQMVENAQAVSVYVGNNQMINFHRPAACFSRKTLPRSLPTGDRAYRALDTG